MLLTGNEWFAEYPTFEDGLEQVVQRWVEDGMIREGSVVPSRSAKRPT